MGSDGTATGNITNTQNVAVSPNGQSSVGIQVTGTWTGTLFVEGSVDGTNYIQTTTVPLLTGGVQTATITADGIYQANIAGLSSFRVRGNTVASGTAVVSLRASTGVAGVMADNPFQVTGYVGMTALTAQGNGASGAALVGNPFRVGLSDGTNAQNWLAAIALSALPTTGVNGNNMGATVPGMWNGTGYVALQGDSTNGTWVNVKTSALPTGAATSANQSSQITQETATAAALGTTADAACGTATGTCSLIALQKFANNTNPVLAAGTNTIGNVGSDPSSGKGTPTLAFLALPATTTTQIIALSGTKTTYVTFAKVFSGGTVNVTFKYGTGTNCATGTTVLEGPYPLIAQTGWTESGGTGPVIIVPSGQALCVTTDASVSGGVKLIYQQI